MSPTNRAGIIACSLVAAITARGLDHRATRSRPPVCGSQLRPADAAAHLRSTADGRHMPFVYPLTLVDRLRAPIRRGPLDPRAARLVLAGTLVDCE